MFEFKTSQCPVFQYFWDILEVPTNASSHVTVTSLASSVGSVRKKSSISAFSLPHLGPDIWVRTVSQQNSHSFTTHQALVEWRLAMLKPGANEISLHKGHHMLMMHRATVRT